MTEEDDVEGEVPSVVLDVLRRYEDVMPDQLPKHLPPRWAVDHQIELASGAKPPAHAPYKISPLELGELRRQLMNCWRVGVSNHPRHLMEHPFFSKIRRMEHCTCVWTIVLSTR